MDKIIKLLIFAALVYGLVWVAQNVNFQELTENAKQKIEQEKTVQRVSGGREQTTNDAQEVTNIKY